jgi:hypothetical protein
MEGLRELEAIYTETPEAFYNETERYSHCVVQVLGNITADEENSAKELAGCVLNSLNPMDPEVEGTASESV